MKKFSAFFQNKKTGFLFTLEAASSLLLLIIASSILLTYRIPPSTAEEFFLCSDVTGVLVKSSAFSDATISLQDKVRELEYLSSLCISANGPSGDVVSSCPPGENVYSFTFPVPDTFSVSSALLGQSLSVPIVFLGPDDIPIPLFLLVTNITTIENASVSCWTRGN